MLQIFIDLKFYSIKIPKVFVVSENTKTALHTYFINYYCGMV